MTGTVDRPILQTERLILRPFEARDVEPAVEYLVTQRSVYMGGPYSRHDAWEHACHLIGHWAVRGFGLFVICLKGSDQAIGDVGPFRPEGWPENEIGWGLWKAEYEGQGYVTEAALTARRYAFDVLGWDTAVSYIDPDNARSIAVAKRLGCHLDERAALPALPDWEGTLVFRHTTPVGGTK